MTFKRSLFTKSILVICFVSFLNIGNAQNNAFHFQDTIFVFNKTTSFNTLHWYLEIFNDTEVDTVLRWKVHFSEDFPKSWDINFDDQNNSYALINDGDSADFTLFGNPSFPQKLIIGNTHNGVASVNDTVQFEIYHPTFPENSKSIYFVFNITSSNNLSVSEKNKPALLVYPNPFTTEFHLENVDINETIYVTDILGKVVYTKEITNHTSKINLPDLPLGMYWLKTHDRSLSILKQ